MGELGRILIVFGIVLVLLGVVFLVGPRIPFVGRLPGDFLIRRGETTVYLPLATSLVLSLVISILLNLFWR
ncbi:MAG TPA: DUF2905 domain-containing protein [Gemmatimonadota bacterium]|nr:DUF2905 domain-containing protein [Gemmatimonadota bacterium]